jgi:hypothetical protein
MTRGTTDLDLVRTEAPPRSDAVCRRLASRVDSVFGFIAYGVLWLFAAAMIATGVLFAGIALVGAHASKAAGYAVLVAYAAAFVVAWVPFGAWVRRRRRAARLLVRDGVLAPAQIDGVLRLFLRGAPFSRVSLAIAPASGTRRGTFSVGGHPRELVEGATIDVLVAPGAAYALAFPVGRAVPVRLAR